MSSLPPARNPLGFVTAPLDYEHYVEKQIKPIVRTIGQVCDIDVEGAVMGTARSLPQRRREDPLVPRGVSTLP